MLSPLIKLINIYFKKIIEKKKLNKNISFYKLCLNVLNVVK